MSSPDDLRHPDRRHHRRATSVAPVGRHPGLSTMGGHMVRTYAALRAQVHRSRRLGRRAMRGPAAAVTRGLLQRVHLERLMRRFPERPVRALFVFINGFLSIGILAAVAMVFRTPSIFPSLGASAFLLFCAPGSPSASPRSTVVGHVIGIGCGVAALAVVGLYSAPPAAVDHMSLLRVVAVALAMASAGGLMVLADAPHPPAGASALIVSLGLITRPEHLVVMVLAVVVLAAQAFVINRVAGLDYPRWQSRRG
jgi:CBS-domain-containing membrane protein